MISSLSAEVQAHHAEGLPTLFKPGSPAAFPPSEVSALLLDPDWVVLVACLDEAVVGYASAQVRKRAETAIRYPRTTLYIHWMAVRAAARRQGVGRALMMATLEVARERGIPSIELDVWAFNTSARAFYEAVGFHAQRMILSFDGV